MPLVTTGSKRARHPGLGALLNKLHQKESLSAQEVLQLQRLLGDLEGPGEHDRGPTGHADADHLAPADVMIPGHATPEGTQRHASRFGRDSAGFYTKANDIHVSSLGIGTYRGAMTADVDDAYITAIEKALSIGVNLIDTSLNYRNQRAERCVGVALRRFMAENGGTRDGVVICTKGGYVVPNAFDPARMNAENVVGGLHSIDPDFLTDQIDRSRLNLGLDTIDVYYIHNPETQLDYVDRGTFKTRIRVAFERLEQAVSDHAIRCYGTATWGGYREGVLNLRELTDMARQIAGDAHHFRFAQLPFNFGLQEALTRQTDDGGTLLDIAAEQNVTVIASASLMQARLTRDLPAAIADLMPGLGTDAQRAVQFTRSTPGITAALVGMGMERHVMENAEIRHVPLLNADDYRRIQAATA